MRIRALAVALATALVIPCISYSEGGALVVREARKETTLTGYTRAASSMNIASEVSGRLRRVNYDIGQSAGEAPFVEVDTSVVDQKIGSAEATRERLATSTERARSYMEYQQKEFERIRKLFEQGAIAEAEHDRVRQGFDQARLELDAIEAERRAVDASLGELKVMRAKHMISVPRGWVIVGRAVEPGEVVGPGSPIGRAADFQRLAVPMSLSTDELDAVREMKQPFPVTVGGRSAQATLNWVNPEFNERTRKSEVELLISSYDGIKRGGIEVSLTARVRADGFIIPHAALTDRYANPTVRPRGAAAPVRVLVTGQTPEGLIIAQTPELRAGMELQPAATTPPAAGK